MRRTPRIAFLFVALLAIAPVLAGCESFDPDSLDPFGLNKKKPLPGQRELLFPNGVPGVAQGIPPEYRAGNQAPVTDDLLPTSTETQQAAGGTAAPAAQTATRAPVKPVRTSNVAKPKPRAKPRRVAKPKPQPKPTETASKPPATQSPWPSTTQPSAPQQGTSSPWPSASSQPQKQETKAGWPSAQGTQDQKLAPWPSAPPSGTFSKQ